MKATFVRRWMIIGSALVALSGLDLNASPITYTYTGANFDPSTFRTDGVGGFHDLITFSNSNYVTASVTLNAALPDNSALTNHSADVISWSLAVVGAFTVSSANGDPLIDLFLGTTGGNITSWNVFAGNGFPVPGEPTDWEVDRIQTSSSTTVTQS